MADVYIKKGYPLKASQLIERISSSKISFNQRNELNYRLAAYYCKYGHQGQCDEIVGRIIGPKKDADAYMQLSYAFYNSEANKEAITLLKQCISLYPQYKEPYLLMGVILGNEGRYEESINWWKQGLAIDPADSRFVSNINDAENLMNKGH